METSLSKLFTPTKVGAVALKHRVVMAPLTRSRASMPGEVPGDIVAEYYAQRASDGGLIISEGAPVSPSARGWYGAPGIFSAAQIAGWKKVTDGVHAKGGRMFAQLWHTGRSSHVDVTEGLMPVSASVDPSYWEDPEKLTSTPTGWRQVSPHRALTIGDIEGVVEDFRKAAANAKAAGFDGVELHGANGYLIDQFLQDISNKRTDVYGGSVENRARLLLEIVAAVTSVFGANRVGVRIGPDGKWNSMGDSNPRALFDYVAKRLDEFALAYLHVIEPRVKGSEVIVEGQGPIAAEHLRTIFKGPILAAGGFDPDTAVAAVESGAADLVAFGRHFISNPDLPRRIKEGLPLAPYDRETFWTMAPQGYVDYPAYDQAVAAA